MTIIFKNAILPKGFKASGVASGIKKSGKLDLALFCSNLPAKSACLFTTNKIIAAPLKINKQHLRVRNSFAAIMVNSGNANCFTGSFGMKDALNTTKILASALGVRNEEILVNSTGIIGKRLPVDKINKAIPGLVGNLSVGGIDKAKRAIMTTDTFAKEITVKFKVGDKTVTICGVAKGAGMISPNMATMLAFILTDANIAHSDLNLALKVCVEESFNCITVDGCMSTNDSVMLLANGASGNDLIHTGKNLKSFTQALKIVCLELAKMVVKDAEGGSKFIQIKVSKAKSFQEARTIALAIANSNLFKTAVYGENPNFGRIAAAAGACGVDIKEENLKMKVSPLHKKEVFVEVALKRGNSSAIVYTSDLTPEYIKINAEYN